VQIAHGCTFRSQDDTLADKLVQDARYAYAGRRDTSVRRAQAPAALARGDP
jgi:hypothetical protein